MTATGKPEDDHEVERPEPGQPAQPPPPPQWLDDQRSPVTPLLPGDDTDQAGPGQAEGGRVQGGRDEAASEAGVPEGGPEAAAADETVSDRTVSDLGADGSSHTVVIPARPGGASTGEPQGDDRADEPQESTSQEPASQQGVAQEPGQAAAPPGAMATSTDIPAPPPFPYAQQVPGAPPAQPPAAQPPPPQPPQAQPPQAQPPAPPPFPYAQEMPDATRVEPIPPQSPAPPPPAPPQQPSQSPPAHEPFPYAQEIPEAPAPPAHEPFPYAQDVPGTPSASPPAAEPFSWAQQLPGAPPPGHGAADPGVAGPVAPPPVIDEPWRTAPKKSKKPRRSLKKPLLIGVAGLAAAALAAAGVIFVPGLLGGGGDDGETGARLAGSIFPVSGAARTDGRDQQISGVAAVGATVVAVGGETDPQHSRGVFLVSGDGGRTFESVPPRAADGGAAPPGGVPVAVGGSSRGWVAIGTRQGGGAVWLSKDGRDWRRQPNAVGDVFGVNNRVERIVGTGSGYLAVGENSRKGDFSDATPAVWLSADGRRWEPRIGDQIGLQVRNGDFSLVEAAAGGDVILLEALIKPDGKDPYRRVWRSEDGGRTWAPSDVPVPKGSRGLMIGGGDGGFLAVREMKSSGDFFGQAYASEDGRTWRKAGTLRADGYRHTSRIVGDRQGFAAVVVRDRDVLVTRSTDGGATWKAAGAAEMKPGLEVMGAALSDGQAILVGHEPGGGDTDAMLGVWDGSGAPVPVDLAKIPGAVRPDHSVVALGASGDLAVAVGSARGDAAAWTSRDGASWTPAQGLGAAFTRPGPQKLTDVAGGGAGWLAVGYDQAVPRGPLVVTSEDGATWQTADSDAAFAASKEGVPVTQAAAAGDAGYVVVGTQGPSVATWFSPDLKSWERGSGAEPEMMRGKKNAGRWMLDVTGGSFGYVAVGGSRESDRNRPSVWTSSDGKEWTLQVLDLPEGVREAHFTHVAARGDTLVATGLAATPKGLDWLGYVSSDAGRSWTPLKSPSEGTPVVVTALAATADGFAAAGTTEGDGGGTDVVSWTSSDGSSWDASTPGGTGLGGDGDQEITGLASFGNRLLGVGRNADAEGDQPVLWSR